MTLPDLLTLLRDTNTPTTIELVLPGGERRPASDVKLEDTPAGPRFLFEGQHWIGDATVHTHVPGGGALVSIRLLPDGPPHAN